MPKAEIKAVTKITIREENEMLALMKRYYHNVDPLQFHTDLSLKDQVIILRKDRHICGFSTQVLNPVNIGIEKVNTVFSGDTVVEEAERNSFKLSMTWVRMMLGILEEHPEEDLYWILTSKGYKTYRFLPTFFREYYPNPDTEPPILIRKIVFGFGHSKYGEKFDSDNWIVQADNTDQRLKKGSADITDNRRKNRDIRFFEERNPGHTYGDELVCIVRFDEKNLKPFILNRLEKAGFAL